MEMRVLQSSLVIAATLLASGGAAAQAAGATSSPWWLHAGPVRVQFNTKADVRLGGAPVPGAGVEASDNTTFGIEIGYDL